MRHNFKSPLTPANIRYLIRRATFASSSRWRGLLGRFAGVRFIGVTGSAGKTTTTKLIAASLRVAGRVRQTHRLVGQLNDQLMRAEFWDRIHRGGGDNDWHTLMAPTVKKTRVMRPAGPPPGGAAIA